MSETFQEHTVILGVNEKLDAMVKLLLEQDKDIVIIADDAARVPSYPADRVTVIIGDFIEPDTLAKAQLKTAATAVILSDTHERSESDADARAVMATLAIEQIDSEINTVVEANTASAAFHLDNAGVDEIIETGGLTAEMLAYSTDHPGFSEHLATLMQFCHQNKVSTALCPERFQGKTLSETTTAYALERKILIGVIEHTGKHTRETLDPDHILDQDDELVYVEII